MHACFVMNELTDMYNKSEKAQNRQSISNHNKSTSAAMLK